MALKTRIQLEYAVNCSPAVLYNRLSTPSGLSEWFADDVRVKGKKYTFIWDDSEQEAEMVQNREGKLVRFNWLEDDESYLEFSISKDELTGDVSLVVVDFAEEGEEAEATDLWNSQISDLKRNLGC
ncbi:MAG: START-like domain-containing protein [Prolixibacteraceae bacterium]